MLPIRYCVAWSYGNTTLFNSQYSIDATECVLVWEDHMTLVVGKSEKLVIPRDFGSGKEKSLGMAKLPSIVT